MSVYDKLASVTKQEDGSYVHNIYKARGDKPRTFKDLESFKKWELAHIKSIQKDLK